MRMGASGNKDRANTTLKRIELTFQGFVCKFLVNPENYTQSEPAKMSITQTKNGAFMEAFGAGIVEITFSGTTGFKSGTGDPDMGYQKIKQLRDTIKNVYDNVIDGQEIKDFLSFYNFTDNEYYETYPDKIELSRNKSQPLLYRYNIHLYCIRKIGQPGQVDQVEISEFRIPNTYQQTLKSANATTTTNPTE